MNTEVVKNTEDKLFWGENPNILLHILDFFPTEKMSFNEKLNALSRTVILLSFILFIFTRSIRVIFVSIFTLILIYVLHQSHNSMLNEGFSENDALIDDIKYNQDIIDSNKQISPALDLIRKNNIPISSNIFQLPSSKNPFSNILVSDYSSGKTKKPAPPCDNPMVKNDILNKAKMLVQEVNPQQNDIADKLFKDINEKLNFEQSLRPFNSTPGTTIPNDQGAFADFCYGSMVSCKNGNLFACARNLTNHQNI